MEPRKKRKRILRPVQKIEWKSIKPFPTNGCGGPPDNSVTWINLTPDEWERTMNSLEKPRVEKLTVVECIEKWGDVLTEEQITKLKEYGKQKTESGLQTGSKEATVKRVRGEHRDDNR